MSLKLFKKRPSKRGSLVDLRNLGIVKPKAPKEDDLKRARDQHQLRRQWRHDVAELRGVVTALREAYAAAKGGFAVGRYEQVKTMIKTAVQRFRRVEEQRKEARSGGSKERLSATTGSHPTPASGDGTLERQKRTGGLMARLRQSAQSFATHEDVDEQSKDFSDLTAKELEAESESMRKEILQLKADYYGLKERLEKLGQDYESSKKLNPTQRYPELKKMVKALVRADLS